MLTVFLLLTAQPAWLEIDEEERDEVIAEYYAPVLARYPDITFTWYDAQTWEVDPSHILMVSAPTMSNWTELAEELRTTPFGSGPYFTVQAIVPAEQRDLPGILDLTALQSRRHLRAVAAGVDSVDDLKDDLKDDGRDDDEAAAEG